MAETAVQALEQRKISRRQVNKPGQIEVNKTTLIACTIRTMSDDGALVMIRRAAHIPDEIVLVIPDEEIRRPAKVKWRRAKSIGIMFK